MGAPAHVLRGNRSSALPQRIVFLAVATTERVLANGYRQQQLAAGHAIFWQRAAAKVPEKLEPRAFTRDAEIWPWIERRCAKGKRLVVVTHDVGLPLQVLGGPQAIAERGWTVTKAIIDEGRFIIRAERERESMLWIDLANYGLSAAAAAVHGDADPSPEAISAEHRANAAAAEAERTARGLADAFTRWISIVETQDLGHFAETLAKQAWNGWRHRFMEHPVFVHRSPPLSAFERSAYYGGRTEVRHYEPPPQHYYKLDGNSFYPSVMRTGLYPTKHRWTFPLLRVDALGKVLQSYLAIARAELRTEDPIYPYRMEDGRLAFPVGHFWTTLATPELAEAKRRGHLLQIGQIALYDRAPLFRSWVDALYSLRTAAAAEGDQFTADAARALLVALYGRFGLRLTRWTTVGAEPELPDEILRIYDADAGRSRKYRRIGGVLAEEDREEAGPDAFVAIPAHVTSYARVKLWRYAEQAGLDHVFYFGSDSIITDAWGRDQLAPFIDAERIGYLKIEGETDALDLIAPGVYRGFDRDRHKGVKADAEDLGGGRYREEQRVGMATALERGLGSSALTRVVEKRIGRGRPIGTIAADGRLEPLRLG